MCFWSTPSNFISYPLGENENIEMNYVFNEAKLKPKTHLSVDTQTWIRGKTNSKGYFTLQNKANGKLLTFATSSQTKLAGMYNLHLYFEHLR